MRCLYSLGHTYERQKQFGNSIEKSEDALKIAKDIGDREKAAISLNMLGWAIQKLGQYDKSIQHFDEALMISQESGDWKFELKNLMNLGNAYYELSQYKTAIKKYNEALKIAKERRDREYELKCLYALGRNYSQMEQFEICIKNHEDALEIAKDIGANVVEETCLQNLGRVALNLGMYDESIQYLNEALTKCQETGNRIEEQRLHGSLGTLYTNLKQPKKAIEKHCEALKISKEIKDREAEAKCLGSIGNVYLKMKDYTNAREKLNEGLEISEQEGYHYGEGKINGLLGQLYSILGQYNDAIEKYKKAVEIFCGMKHKMLEAQCLGTLGIALYHKCVIDQQFDHFDEAKIPLRKAIQMYEELWKTLKDDTRRVCFDDTNTSSTEISKYLHTILYEQRQYIEALEIWENSRSKSLELVLSEKKNHSSNKSNSSFDFDEIRKLALSSKSDIIIYSEHCLIEGLLLIWVIKCDLQNACTANDTINGLVHKPITIKREFKSLQYIVELTRRSLGIQRRSNTELKKRWARLSSSNDQALLDNEVSFANEFSEEELQIVQG